MPKKITIEYIFPFLGGKIFNLRVKEHVARTRARATPEGLKVTTVAVMKMAGRPTLVEYKAAGGLGSESRGQSEPVGRARRQPQPQTERLRAASAPEHRPH